MNVRRDEAPECCLVLYLKEVAQLGEEALAMEKYS